VVLFTAKIWGDCLRRTNPKAQSAMEYLVTYGWAILIISIVLGAIFSLGLLNPNTFVNSQCIFPAEFSCLSSSMDSSGNLIINLMQSTTAPINITAIGCNSNATIANMLTFNGPQQKFLPIGTNITISGNTMTPLKCYTGNVVATIGVGTLFKGYVIVNYTDLQTGFPHTSIGTLIQKIMK
jgi:hypothetical protein